MPQDSYVAESGLTIRTLYGRRKGKKLRSRQAELVLDALPHLAIDHSRPIDDVAALFPHASDSVRMEIGFGGAEHLISEASRYPHVGYIGCEPFVNGVAKLLVQIKEQGLGNIRLHHGDAREVLMRLPARCLERVDVLYPDPWPKWRQRKRRFLSHENITLIARALQAGGELRFATDIDDYAGWVLARILQIPEWRWIEGGSGERPWTEPWPDWPGTRYEAKAFREGRQPVYLTFKRNPS